MDLRSDDGSCSELAPGLMFGAQTMIIVVTRGDLALMITNENRAPGPRHYGVLRATTQAHTRASPLPDSEMPRGGPACGGNDDPLPGPSAAAYCIKQPAHYAPSSSESMVTVTALGPERGPE